MTERVMIKTLWFWRKGETSPELLVAWDEYTVDQNPDGFAVACHKAYEEVRAEDVGNGSRRIEIHAEWNPIERAFLPIKVEATSEAVS